MRTVLPAARSHEPRVLVSGWKRGRWSAAGRTADESLCTGVQSWVYAFNGDYIGHRDLTRHDLDRYDIAIINTSPPLAPLVRLAEARPASLKWVSLIEGSADDYWAPQDHLKELLDRSDLINVINWNSLPFFRALTRSRVAYIGIPYPVDGVRKLMTPIAKRDRRIFLCTQLLRRWNDQLAARSLGLPYYGHETAGGSGGTLQAIARLLRTRSFGRMRETNFNRARLLYSDPALEMVPFTKDTTRHFSESGRCLFWMNLDSRYTWARYVLDAAALCVPIVTTAATGHGERFFPLTTLGHCMDVEQAVQISRRLIDDRDFYEHVADVPAQKLAFLKAEPMKQALLRALENPDRSLANV